MFALYTPIRVCLLDADNQADWEANGGTLTFTKSGEALPEMATLSMPKKLLHISVQAITIAWRHEAPPILQLSGFVTSALGKNFWGRSDRPQTIKKFLDFSVHPESMLELFRQPPKLDPNDHLWEVCRPSTESLSDELLADFNKYCADPDGAYNHKGVWEHLQKVPKEGK